MPSKTSGYKLRAINNKQKVLDLRIKGLSIRKIAEELKISSSTVYKCIVEGFSEINQTNKDLSVFLRDQELERLENLTFTANDLLEKAKTQSEKIKIGTFLLKVSESRRRLLGIDEVQQNVTANDLGGIKEIEIDIRPDSQE
jgi:predicted DNA-binding protein YlxM (UPF0122 family)